MKRNNTIRQSQIDKAILFAAQNGTLIQHIDITDDGDGETGPMPHGGIYYTIRCGGILLYGEPLWPNGYGDEKPYGFCVSEVSLIDRKTYRRSVAKLDSMTWESKRTPWLTLRPEVNELGYCNVECIGRACRIVPVPKTRRRCFENMGKVHRDGYRSQQRTLAAVKRSLRGQPTPVKDREYHRVVRPTVVVQKRLRVLVVEVENRLRHYRKRVLDEKA